MLSRILNMHRLKFTVLDELFKETNHQKMVNIHIDLHSILSDLYRSSNYAETNWLDEDHSMIISSCIINLAAHYRLYFYNRYRASTRIFLYFCDTRPRNNAEYYKEYGYKFFDKYVSANKEFNAVNVEVTTNLKLCKIIASYIPSIYYIDCRNIEPVVAAGYMGIKYSGSHIVLTRDEYWYQLLNLPSKSIIVHLKRDSSFCVTRDNVYRILLRNNTYESTHTTPEMLSIVYSFGGVKSRDIRGLQNYGYVKILKILDLAISRNMIQPIYTQIKNVLDEIYSGDKEDLLISIFRAIDLKYQLNELTIAQKELLNNCLESKYNKRDLLKLNDTHYIGDNSLMLEELFKGIEDTFKW